jgi:hypothetical protein
MALRQIHWTEGAGLLVDINAAGDVIALECANAAVRPAIVSVYRNATLLFSTDGGTGNGHEPMVAVGETRRWDLPKNRQWTYDQLTDEAGFRAELRLA